MFIDRTNVHSQDIMASNQEEKLDAKKNMAASTGGNRLQASGFTPSDLIAASAAAVGFLGYAAIQIYRKNIPAGAPIGVRFYMVFFHDSSP
jgi:hypothetical protein